jgi:CRP-like cAMP-binding protein
MPSPNSIYSVLGTNKLLAQLDENALTRLKSHLKLVSVRAKDTLHQAEERIPQIFFPTTAVLSLLTTMEDGTTIESGTVGREGATWNCASFGSPKMPCETVVTVAGNCFKIGVKVIEDEIQRNEGFKEVMQKYSHALIVQSIRSTACNGLHTLPQRSARWLLTTFDRVEGDCFVATHELIATLLGASRPSVSLTLGMFQNAGLVESKRGTLTLLNRQKLEMASCECYCVIREVFEKAA